MKANELRLGNYVYDRGGKVLRIDFFDYIDADYNFKFGQKMYVEGIEVHGLTEYILSAKPIPLTEEWLLKFGFDKNYINIMELGVLFLYVSDDEYSFAPSTRDDEEYFNVKLKYVHQLQNLYFALTGEEITIKD